MKGAVASLVDAIAMDVVVGPRRVVDGDPGGLCLHRQQRREEGCGDGEVKHAEELRMLAFEGPVKGQPKVQVDGVVGLSGR